MQPIFDIGVSGQEVHGPRQGDGGGFRPREEERDDVVHDLGVGQALVVNGVAGAEQC